MRLRCKNVFSLLKTFFSVNKNFDQRCGAMSKKHVFCSILLLFLPFSDFLCKNVVKTYFDQRLECSAPKHLNVFYFFIKVDPGNQSVVQPCQPQFSNPAYKVFDPFFNVPFNVGHLFDHLLRFILHIHFYILLKISIYVVEKSQLVK